MSTAGENEYEKLLKDYNSLQLRVTRFSNIEQELINTRDRLDQELVLYKRLNQFNTSALNEFSDSDFFKYVCETIIDVFETESALIFAENYIESSFSIFGEGLSSSDFENNSIDKELKKFAEKIDTGKAILLGADHFKNLKSFTNYSKGLFFMISDKDFGYKIYLFALISKEYEPVYTKLQPRHETIFSVFSQQVQSILTNRKKESKIKEQFEKISSSESELRKLSQIATRTQNGVIISDDHGRIEWVNDAFTQITGYTLDEVKGKKPKDFLQGKETDITAIEKIKDALWSKKSVEQTLINYTKNNEPYHNSLQITPVFDEQGKLKNFIAIQKDITLEIKARQDILNINSRFELIANKSNVGIWELDMVTGKSSWNTILQKQYGADPEKMASDFNGYWYECIHTEDRKRVKENFDHFLSSKSEILEDEIRINRQTDQEIRILKTLTIAERDKQGVILRLVGTNIDITEEKKTEIELQKNLQQQELLSETALELNNLNDFSVTLNSVLNKVGNHTGVSRVYIFENIDSGNACNNTFEWCNEGVEPQLENLQGIPYDAIPYWKNELTTTGHIFSENIAELPQEVRDILEPQEIKSILVFPLKVKGEFYGFIGFDECVRNKKWSKSELALIKAYSGIISNTFERKISEDSLIASEKKYRSIIENINLGLVEMNATGEVVFSNKQFHDLTQIENPSALALGNNAEDILQRKELKGKLLSFKKMDELVYEMNIKQKDSSVKTLLVSNAPVLNQQNEMAGSISIYLDITPVKALQVNLESALKERDVFLKKVNSLKTFYESVLNHSPSDIAVVNTDMTLNYSNEQFNEFEKAVRKSDVAEGSKIQGVLLNHVQDAIQERKLIQKEESFINKNGESIYKLRSILPFYDGENHLQHIIISGVDITEIKKIENTLLRRNDELKKINTELDNFVYSVSHDLRSPLLSIKGILNLIFKGSQLDNKLSDYLKLIDKSVIRLDGTIQEILEYSRNARLDVKEEKTDLKKIILDIHEDLKFSTSQKIEFSLQFDCENVVLTDSARITTILKNIIGNAFKYQIKDNQNCKVSIGVSKNKKDELIIQISDNGEGISDENSKKVFDMFYRASNTSVGTGLGLYICKEIISKMNGEIELKSKLKEGTTVRLLLPVKFIQ